MNIAFPEDQEDGETQDDFCEWYLSEPARSLSWRVDHPDEIGESWHICRDFLDPLIEILEKVEAKGNARVDEDDWWYDCKIKDIWHLALLRLTSDPTPNLEYYNAGRLRAATFLRVNGLAHISDELGHILDKLADEAQEMVDEARREAKQLEAQFGSPTKSGTVHEKLHWWTYDAVIFLDFLEPRILFLRQLSSELRRRWPTDARNVTKRQKNGRGHKGGRPPIPPEERRRRIKLHTGWIRARESGVQMKKFARDNGIALKDLKTILNWCSKSKSRGQLS